MSFMVVVFSFPVQPKTSVGDMNYSVVVLGGVLLLSLVWYYLPVYGGVHWFTGPVATISKEAPELLNLQGSKDERSSETATY